MIKKLLLFLLLGIGTIWSWTGSNQIVRLIYPKSYYYETKLGWDLLDTPITWQPYIVPRGVYGIVANASQGVDKHQITLKDVTTGDTWLLHEEQDHNSVSYALLSPGTLIKKSFFNGQHSYEIELKAWD